MRKMLSLLALFVLTAGVWLGARWVVHRGEIKVTLVLDDHASGLRPGARVLNDGKPIGVVARVDRIDDREAVTIRLDADHRRDLVSDSMVTVEGGSVVVSNTFAVGRPVDDGAILSPRQDRITTWLTRHGGAVKPYLDAARMRADAAIDGDFEGWTQSVPSWRREGQQAFQRHLREVNGQVTRAEARLRSLNRSGEARKLKERFDQWLANVKR
jgi:hypothetical protein